MGLLLFPKITPCTHKHTYTHTHQLPPNQTRAKQEEKEGRRSCYPHEHDVTALVLGLLTVMFRKVMLRNRPGTESQFAVFTLGLRHHVGCLMCHDARPLSSMEKFLSSVRVVHDCVLRGAHAHQHRLQGSPWHGL